MYNVVAFIGEAGSGKDTILKKVEQKIPSLVHTMISCTTRPPREGEVDGVNYFFLTGEEFGQKVLNNEMLEATCFNDWFYGTSIDSLDKDKINLIVFYVRATEKNRLIRQLNRETDPDIDEIIRRLKADRIDFEELEFDHFELDNNTQKDLDLNIQKVCAVIKTLAAQF